VPDPQSNDFGLLAAIGGDCASAVSLAAGDQATVPDGVEWQVLLVRRYDRRLGDVKQELRLHQEDFCQALGVPPELKYQQIQLP
jgi:serine/threonine protein kinase HipA of HipAB toxin-antitoxin module